MWPGHPGPGVIVGSHPPLVRTIAPLRRPVEDDALMVFSELVTEAATSAAYSRQTTTRPASDVLAI
jgi:hypothetical protein